MSSFLSPQVGLLNHLATEFKPLLLTLPAYLALFSVYAAVKLGLLLGPAALTPGGLWGSPVFIALSISQKAGSLVYYTAIVHAVLTLGDARWYDAAPWVKRAREERASAYAPSSPSTGEPVMLTKLSRDGYGGRNTTGAQGRAASAAATVIDDPGNPGRSAAGIPMLQRQLSNSGSYRMGNGTGHGGDPTAATGTGSSAASTGFVTVGLFAPAPGISAVLGYRGLAAPLQQASLGGHPRVLAGEFGFAAASASTSTGSTTTARLSAAVGNT